MIARGLLWITNYGFSLTRLSVAGLAIVILFAVCFWLLGTPATEATLGSVKYFLGVNDSFSSLGLSALGSLEALIGMIFFAVFTTVLLSLFLDRS